MYLSSTRKFSARWLVSVCEAELCPEHTGETHTWEDTSGNIWEQGTHVLPSVERGIQVSGVISWAFTIQQNTLLVCQHETAPAALALSQNLYLSACDTLWTTTHKHSWSELLSGILPPAYAGLTWVILAPNHMLVTAIIWVKKKKFPENKLEWIQASCDYVLFIVRFIDFSTDTLYLPQIFCKYHQQHNLSLLKWGWKNFLTLMVLLIIFFFWKGNSLAHHFLRTQWVPLKTTHARNEGYVMTKNQNLMFH